MFHYEYPIKHKFWMKGHFLSVSMQHFAILLQHYATLMQHYATLMEH